MGLITVMHIITTRFLPAKFSAAAFSICNITARFVTVAAPLVAEQPQPLPIFVLGILSAVGALLSLLINDQTSDKVAIV